MNVIAPPAAASLQAELARHIGRHTQKSFDWDAFPSNRGFPELARAQMRYIGAGVASTTLCASSVCRSGWRVGSWGSIDRHNARCRRGDPTMPR